jgi:hypothetical protein
MKIPESFKKVTRLSKTLALILFVALPFGGFWLGRIYQSGIQPKTVYVTQNRLVKIYPTESPELLVQRCGAFPSDSKLGINEGFFATSLSGPFWAPDCRHIAWADFTGVKPEGIYLYNERSVKSKLIYQDKDNRMILVRGWEDSENIKFDLYPEGSLYLINVNDGSVVKVEL